MTHDGTRIKTVAQDGSWSSNHCQSWGWRRDRDPRWLLISAHSLNKGQTCSHSLMGPEQKSQPRQGPELKPDTELQMKRQGQGAGAGRDRITTNTREHTITTDICISGWRKSLISARSISWSWQCRAAGCGWNPNTFASLPFRDRCFHAAHTCVPEPAACPAWLTAHP